MPLSYEEDVVVIEGVCDVEEAEELLTLLQGHPEARLDLSGCDWLHTAVFQVICAGRARVAAPPRDPFLARCLEAYRPAPPE